MKKHLRLILPVVFAAVMAAGCDSLLNGDSYFVPQDFSIIIQLVDTDGKDLLDSTADLNWRDSTIICTFKNKTFEVENEDNYVSGAFNFVITTFYDKYTNVTSQVLYFGNFNGMTNYDDDVVFSWPDNSSDTLHVYNRVTPSETQPSAATDVERYLTYKGEYVMTLPIVITKTTK